MSAVVIAASVLGVLLLAVIPLMRFSSRVERAMTSIALAVFRDRLETEGRNRQRRKRALQSIHATTTYPVYASRTLLYMFIVGVAASLISLRFIDIGLDVVVANEPAIRTAVPDQFGGLGPTSVTQLTFVQLFALLVLSGATVGVGSALAVYYLRWWSVQAQAEKRAVLIDESIARTIAFIYALSRSGMVFPEVMRTVAANRRAFGEGAEEIGVIVKDMDLFGADLVTAMERLSARTPSEQFADFAQNFANVLQSGQNVSEYLREQYEQHQEERIDNQEQLLDMFTALGEAYVAGLVAGPLFFITILIIFGVLAGGVLDFLQFIVYLLVPIANVGFIVYLDTISEPLKSFDAPTRRATVSRVIDARHVSEPGASQLTRPDGGVSAPRYDLETNQRRLAAYRRLEQLRTQVLNPIETLVRRPATVLWLAVPIALAAMVLRAWPVIIGAEPFNLARFDDIAIQSGFFVVLSFALVQEIHAHRIRRIEAAIPDLLDRLASTNDAGMTLTESLRRVDKSDLGALNIEVNRLLADINWGARTERALHRFSERIWSSTVDRIVALITNAMMASGHLGPVIRIAADEAREDRRLTRRRRQEMFMYVIIIYLSFFVFLAIAVALQEVLIPALPTANEIGSIAQTTGPGAVDIESSFPIAPVEEATRARYTLTLFHAALLQSVASGFVAGQMGEGSIRNGAKHVAIMVAIAYVVFLAMG